MLETSRRSAISTSELGLYSDRGDRYGRSRYGLIVRKLAIGVTMVVTVILVAIFMYNFASATSGNSKINQETKHIYILQNALKKSPNLSRKSANSAILSEAVVGAINQTDTPEDRSGAARPAQRNATSDLLPAEARVVTDESSEQNLHNFKQRRRMLKSVEDAKGNEEPEARQLFDNHAIVYRVRQRYKHPESNEDMNAEETRPTPFHWELKTPQPTSFKRPRYPQLSQYRHPQTSRSIQDIIKYLTNNDSEMPNHGIKFTGIYMNPKKYDLLPGIEEMMSSNDKSDEQAPPAYPIAYNSDPFYQYKPKHPADVNLLATSNVRFSPSGLHRYSPYYDYLYHRPLFNYNVPLATGPQYDSVGSYSTNSLEKNRKPKPFSVMLDIYPITDVVEQNKKTSWPRPQGLPDSHDPRLRPFQYRGPKLYAPSAQSPVPLAAASSPAALLDEEERQQMVLHLNLYPRKKSKLSRHDIIDRSESMGPEERQQFAKKIMSPLESIAKQLTDHSAIEQLRGREENGSSRATGSPLARYQDISLHDENDEDGDFMLDPKVRSDNGNDDAGENVTFVPSNHKLIADEDHVGAERYESDSRKAVASAERDCASCESATIEDPEIDANEGADLSKDVEGSRRFGDDPSHLD